MCDGALVCPGQKGHFDNATIGLAKNALSVVRLASGRVATVLHAYDVELIADKPIYSCAELLDRHRSPNYISRFAHAILIRAAACIVVLVGTGGVIAVD